MEHDLVIRNGLVVDGTGSAPQPGLSVAIDGDVITATWMLTHWARDRTRGPKLTVEAAVKKMTADTAALFGLDDRGVLAVGKRADVNVIDHEHWRLREPRLVADLPAGGTRLLQAAEGYVATVVGGVVTREHDEFTGARPGRLIRS